jgi:hypothetical protein
MGSDKPHARSPRSRTGRGNTHVGASALAFPAGEEQSRHRNRGVRRPKRNYADARRPTGVGCAVWEGPESGRWRTCAPSSASHPRANTSPFRVRMSSPSSACSGQIGPSRPLAAGSGTIAFVFLAMVIVLSQWRPNAIPRPAWRLPRPSKRPPVLELCLVAIALVGHATVRSGKQSSAAAPPCSCLTP